MCDDQLRDGTTTNRIPENQEDCDDYNCNTDPEYGMQENYDNYYTCKATVRNKGLFTANQNLNNRHSATYTRQNPNANRYGYECAEERDYYPYWRPSPWKDIAVMTNTPTRCAAYQAASENVLGRWYCAPPPELLAQYKEEGRTAWIPIEQNACEQLYYTDPVTNDFTFGVWTQADSHGLEAPQCIQNRWSRDNHLGNVVGGYMASFNWTIPEGIDHEQCAFRVRYNITTSEYGAWKDEYSTEVGSVDWRNNTDVTNPNPNDDPAKISIWETYGLTYDDVASSFDENTNNNANNLRDSREYVLKNNPAVDMFGDLLSTTGYLKLQMNVNTNQFGRTFQDRGHRHAIRPASGECADTLTHNLQVRGKRGNIVQTYPGMEYDFVPDRLDIAVGECVHIQWTGSNTNPNNNDGQGKQGTDRSNIVLLREKVYDEYGQPDNYNGQFGRSFPATMDEEFLDLSEADKTHLALNSKQMGGELSELDDSGTYFDMAPFKVTMEGIYHYLCTRNNNFSNRSQKGKIVASVATVITEAIGWNGGTVEALTGSTITIAEGVFSSAVDVTMQIWPHTETHAKEWGVRSDYVMVYMNTAGEFHLSLPYSHSYSINGHSLYFNEDHDAELEPTPANGWVELDTFEFENSLAQGTASGSGIYVVTTGPVNVAAAVLIPMFVLGMLGGGGFAYHKHKNGELELPCSSGKEI